MCPGLSSVRRRVRHRVIRARFGTRGDIARMTRVPWRSDFATKASMPNARSKNSTKVPSGLAVDSRVDYQITNSPGWMSAPSPTWRRIRRSAPRRSRTSAHPAFETFHTRSNARFPADHGVAGASESCCNSAQKRIERPGLGSARKRPPTSLGQVGIARIVTSATLLAMRAPCRTICSALPYNERGRHED